VAAVEEEEHGSISLEEWRAAWESNPEIAAMTGVEGLLSILLPQGHCAQIDRKTGSGAWRDTAAK